MVTMEPAPGLTPEPSASRVQVHPGNREQLRAWDGEEGLCWAADPDTFELTLADYDPALFAAAAITPTGRILDIGCGTGGTTVEAARRAARGSALGVDLSSPMLAVARRRADAEGLQNVSFLQADAQIHPFQPASFDVAIGRTSAMFFADRVAALANVRRALTAGGRLVLLVWQPPHRNEWFLEFTAAMAAGRTLPPPPPDAPHPFTMADPAVDRDVLTAAGYSDVVVTGLQRTMNLGADPGHAYDWALGLLAWMLDGLDGPAQDRARRVLRRTIDTHHGRDGVRFASATWLITAHNPSAAV
jgi:SAM-dependent methyltransferase